MNVHKDHKWLLLLLLSLAAMQLHTTLPHSDLEICEICVFQPHTAIIPEDQDELALAPSIAAVTPNFTGNLVNQILAYSEPIRGSPAFL